MPTTLKDEAAIAGIGETEYSKNSKRSELQLGCEALRAAIQDCGVDPKQIDGMSSFTMDSTDEIELARALGIGELRFISKAHHGGGAATATLHQAAMAVATGAANYVVCYRTLNGRSGHRFSMGVSGELITSDTIHYSWYMPSGLLTPASWVAMFHRRYAHKFGTTAEQLGHVAISIRDFAVTNPRAFFYQRPLAMEDYLAAKWIVEPFRLYDCCQESDGAACCIVTTPERARDLRQPPALIRGVAQGSGDGQEAMTSFYRDDIGAIPEMDLVARQVWEISGLAPDDVDAAIIYDAFTAIVLWQLESFGFCKPGEAQEFAASGGIARGGRLPINTNGGQLSEAYIHGMNGVNEGVRLVRGESVNQPDKDVNHVLVTSGVGVPTSAMVLGKMD
jgi:acetyl-CoA acetyltransferase